MKDSYSIIGGGIIGLSIGWQLARKGMNVQIFERDAAGKGASWVAAGMLAPRSEAGFEESEQLAFGLESVRLYPQFLKELEQDTGTKVAMEPNGSLMIGLNRDDTERLRRMYDFRKKIGLPLTWLSGAEARELEPLISPRTVSAVSIPDDIHIDNHKLVEALREAFLRCKGTLHEHTPVEQVHIERDRVVNLRAAGKNFDAGTVILSAGSWSKSISGIPESITPPVRPVKGQIITMRMDKSCELKHIIRATDAYFVPKEDGRLVLGATSEEMGFDTTISAGLIKDLLEHAWEAVPSIYDLKIEIIEAGLRPASRDHEPIIGPTEISNLYYATGHFRSGILFAPVTAYGVAEMLSTKTVPPILRHYLPSRFFGTKQPSPAPHEA
jgi:glycine oxidase